MLFVAVPSERTGDVLTLIRTTAPHAYWSIRPTPAYRGLPAPTTDSAGRHRVAVGSVPVP
jgi:hypothetical protein